MLTQHKHLQGEIDWLKVDEKKKIGVQNGNSSHLTVHMTFGANQKHNSGITGRSKCETIRWAYVSTIDNQADPLRGSPYLIEHPSHNAQSGMPFATSIPVDCLLEFT